MLPPESAVTDQTPSTSIVLVCNNQLDIDILTMLFAARRNFRLVLATTRLNEAVIRMRGLCPDVVVVDPSVHIDAVKRLSEAINKGPGGHLFVLDSRVREGRLHECLRTVSTSYFTRAADADQIVRAVRAAAVSGERYFCPTLEGRVLKTAHGLQLRVDPREPSISTLTDRELQVMRLISEGHSVRECAQRLSLSESTIDNHKARIMKKLRLNKSQHLTRRAIRDGLIVA